MSINYLKRELTEVFMKGQRLVNTGKDIPYAEFREYFDEFNKVHTFVMNNDPALSLEDHLQARQKERGLKGEQLPPSVCAILVNNKIFSQGELSVLTGTSRQNISSKVKKGETEVGTIKANFKNCTSMDDFDPIDTYFKSIAVLTTTINSERKDNELIKIQAVEKLLRFAEPEVVNELKKKYNTLNALMNFIINTLIPNVNKRLREILREVHEKAKAGEDVSKLQIDVRAVFKFLLPTNAELDHQIHKDGWVSEP